MCSLLPFKAGKVIDQIKLLIKPLALIKLCKTRGTATRLDPVVSCDEKHRNDDTTITMPSGSPSKPKKTGQVLRSRRLKR